MPVLSREATEAWLKRNVRTAPQARRVLSDPTTIMRVFNEAHGEAMSDVAGDQPRVTLHGIMDHLDRLYAQFQERYG